MTFRHLFFLVTCSLGMTAHAQIQADPGHSTGDVGTVTFTYFGSQVTYATVRAADSNIWLQQNLGAPQVATAVNDPSAYGHNFQWGRWDDGHQLPGSDTERATVLNPNNNPSGIPNGSDKFYYGGGVWWWAGAGTNSTWTAAPPSATNGTDPCAALGKHWRLATRQEWEHVMTRENITTLATAFSSHLKLTAAGWRSFDWAILGNQGAFGNYWTSTVSPGGYPVTIQLAPDANSTHPDEALPGYGMSVRCIKTCTTPHQPAAIIGEDSICSGSTGTWYIAAVDEAVSYTWQLPAGWTGSSTGDTITLTAGSTGGVISVRANGTCDTGLAQTLDVYIYPDPVPAITVHSDTLGTSMPFSTYQWYRNDTLIQGETGATHVVTKNGVYTVVVTDAHGCTGTSDPYPISNVHVSAVGAAPAIAVYPNPARDVVHISSRIPVQAAVRSMDGKLLLQHDAGAIDIGGLPAGLYILQVKDGRGRVLHTEKLVKIRQ